MANSNLSEYQDKLLQNISALSKGLRWLLRTKDRKKYNDLFKLDIRKYSVFGLLRSVRWFNTDVSALHISQRTEDNLNHDEILKSHVDGRNFRPTLVKDPISKPQGPPPPDAVLECFSTLCSVPTEHICLKAARRNCFFISSHSCGIWCLHITWPQRQKLKASLIRRSRE
jgi:hypothetical protein